MPIYSWQTVTFMLLILFSSLGAKASEREDWYQQVWCDGQNGQAEAELNDGTRVDCLTKTHAIEMDFSSKWPEAIGQSLYYAMQTGRKAGIVLIIRNLGELYHWDRMNTVIKKYQLPITTWKLGP